MWDGDIKKKILINTFTTLEGPRSTLFDPIKLLFIVIQYLNEFFLSPLLV